MPQNFDWTRGSSRNNDNSGGRIKWGLWIPDRVYSDEDYIKSREKPPTEQEKSSKEIPKKKVR